MDNVNFISKRELKILYDKITELINNNFIKLITEHKKILTKYLYKLIVLFSSFYYSNNFIKQLYLNKYQDIFSLLVLLMPYYDLNKSKIMTSLDELFLNHESNAKKLDSSYYIDHLNLNPNNISDSEYDYLKKYFNNALLCISNTLEQIHCLILPNWTNIFPYTMETYKQSYLYTNFIQNYLYRKKFERTKIVYELILTQKQTDFEFMPKNKFALGYPILYGTIYNFLYTDIKSIKWMIYDLNIENKIILPNIIYLANKLGINSIVDKPWNKLSKIEEQNIIELWKNFYTNNEEYHNQISLKSLVLFYLRWEQNNNKLDSLGLPKECFKLIGEKYSNLENETNVISSDYEINDQFEMNIHDDKKLEKCLKKIYPKIKLEDIYNYIYNCVHKFRFTWYGYCCLDENKNILNEDNFFEKYFLLSENKVIINLSSNNNNNNKNKYLYITPKNVYNFCKALIHQFTLNSDTNTNTNTNKDENKYKYECFSTECKWNNVNNTNQEIFLLRLNDKNEHNMENWFNINGNIRRTYPEIINDKIMIKNIMDKYIEIFKTSTLFPDVIFQTLVYNGMLSFYKYNPIMTDSLVIPNKNRYYKQWNKHILSNVDVKSYTQSYHAFSNTMLEAHGKQTINTIIDSKWYTNFGANWIAQIQLYHHYLHNRVMFITGATGAGKSTLAPFLLVYGVKILNYNNNAKVVCTQPRTQPVKDNSEQISKNIGIPITIKKTNEFDEINSSYKNTTIGEAIPQDINYIQYKHKKGSLTDDLYHPYLRLYTDGSLYNIIKQNYFFKKPISSHELINPNDQEYLSTNIFDIILVDEAHEHNTYMDMILTLSRFGVYINNQITLGIISATMDDDEIIYRKYFEPIDDNWKAPLNIIDYDRFKNNPVDLDKLCPNAKFIDRRIHLSIPFGGMNFDVKEYPNESSQYPESVGTFTDMKKINKKVIEIVKHILNTSNKGDILIFQPGESDIKKLVTEINLETPSNVIAIPFYSKLDNEILENIVKKIDQTEIRNKKIRYPKNKYDITEIFKIPPDELLPEGTYNRFIVIATNIAEASITIDTLEYVIETGNQKINVYDPDTNQDNLETRSIAIPNQKQRKGRVGRTQPGFAYYTYNRTLLGEKVVYKMNIQNINDLILELITGSDVQYINSESDPYKVSDYKNIKKCLQKQYIYISCDAKNLIFNTVLYANKTSYENTSNITYPYSDGKYKLETLEDTLGTFFIIHPNEDYFVRDPLTLKIINTNAKINYFNKVTKAFIYGKSQGIIGDNNLLTPYGKLINSIVEFMEFSSNPIDFTKIILDCFSFGININTEIFKNILVFIVFKTTTFNFKVSKYLIGKADFLIYSALIDDSFYHELKFEDILDKLDLQLNKLADVVNFKVNKLVDEKIYGRYKNSNLNNSYKINNKNIDEIKKVLSTYYIFRFKIDIINYNTKYILKDKFKELIVELIKQKNKPTMSDEYLIFINKLILYYINSSTKLDKKVINELVEKLQNNIVDTNISIKQATDTIKKINKLFESSCMFENEFLAKINLLNKIAYPKDLLNKFNGLSEYDKICFIIGKNFPQNIAEKVQETEFYLDHYRKDINRIYGLTKNTIKLNESKTVSWVTTKVPEDIRNYFIFVVNIDDNYDIDNLMVFSELVIKMLDNYFTSIGIKSHVSNYIFNEENAKQLYQETDKFNNIMKKIDKIIKYIRDN